MTKQATATPQSSAVLGWREWLELPELGIKQIKAKIDTGARSSSLHAYDIQCETVDGQKWVNFKVHPHQHNDGDPVNCRAPVKDYRQVTDSGGHRSMRYVIETTISLGGELLTAEITLADRSDMLFRMLLGRTAMNGRYLVNPASSYCLGKPTATMTTSST
ncbi:ATP-dependent zinc protease [Spongiibacter sp. KMU-158]|uniref:ATP-dependent zinc protease n=1 Tax=Spongiibacter pelagi TaxID=2760804 RepID=A0A927C0L7_9GAMM|nr:ATP-dependent zinc protease [Spongiibacter pelagi]MBD2857471.1 ATP-dependent zinc protease [Spongiibacter pelagi]